MKNNKIILIISGIAIFVLLAISINPVYFYWLREKSNPNTVIVDVNSGLKVEDFTIKWRTGIDEPITIFSNGSDHKKKFKEYGKNYFSVYFRDSLIANFQQFKLNNWHGHKYKFEISKTDNEFLIDWSAIGPDSVRTKKTSYNKTYK